MGPEIFGTWEHFPLLTGTSNERDSRENLKYRIFKLSSDEEVNDRISNASALNMLSRRSLYWISIFQDDKVIYISMWMAKILLKCHFVCQFCPDLQVGRPPGSHVSLAPGLWPQFFSDESV